MNNINAKTIRDISEDIAQKNSVAKKDVEELFNFFYQKVVKKHVSSFDAPQYSIDYFGTFSLILGNKNVESILAKCVRSIKYYEDKIAELKEDTPSWIHSTLAAYKNIQVKVKEHSKNHKELVSKRTEHHARKNKKNN